MKNPNIKLSILSKPRMVKRFFVISIDLILSIFAVWLAFYLRIGEFIPLWGQQSEYYPLPASIGAILISCLLFNYFNLYKIVFRFLSSQAMINLSKVYAVYGIIYGIIFTVIGVDGVPRTIGIIQPLIFFILLGFSRFFAAYYLGNVYENKPTKKKKKQAIIYGAGNRGYQLSRALSQNNKINIVGFFDDDISFHGNKINNLNVFNPKEIDTLIETKDVSEIIFAFDNIKDHNFKHTIAKFKDKNLALRILPTYDDFLTDNKNLNNIPKLSIEDILGREPISPDPNLMKKDITNKTVLVSGAGGSIGSQLCKEILMQRPKKLILIENSEYALYNIFEELKKLGVKGDFDITPILCSVTDKNYLELIFNNFKPNTIFHAAAYKHVNLVEKNINEGIKNNVFGTLNLANLSINNNVKKFVLISTDKAVRPSNVMGASKRISEMILQALSEIQNETLFSIVRFGNVLGSSGSVVPLFQSQIKMGGPVTVTHPDVNRYFMTVTEAAQLVIQAGAMTNQAIKKVKTTPIFLLDMGQPIKILDLAKLMIQLSGLTVYEHKKGSGDIEIKFTELRKGEKLNEELLIGSTSIKSVHPKIKYANEIFVEWPVMKDNLLAIEKLIAKNNEKDIRQLIFDITSKTIIHKKN